MKPQRRVDRISGEHKIHGSSGAPIQIIARRNTAFDYHLHGIRQTLRHNLDLNVQRPMIFAPDTSRDQIREHFMRLINSNPKALLLPDTTVLNTLPDELQAQLALPFDTLDDLLAKALFRALFPEEDMHGLNNTEEDIGKTSRCLTLLLKMIQMKDPVEECLVYKGSQHHPFLSMVRAAITHYERQHGKKPDQNIMRTIMLQVEEEFHGHILQAAIRSGLNARLIDKPEEIKINKPVVVIFDDHFRDTIGNIHPSQINVKLPVARGWTDAITNGHLNAHIKDGLSRSLPVQMIDALNHWNTLQKPQSLLAVSA